MTHKVIATNKIISLTSLPHQDGSDV